MLRCLTRPRNLTDFVINKDKAALIQLKIDVSLSKVAQKSNKNTNVLEMSISCRQPVTRIVVEFRLS